MWTPDKLEERLQTTASCTKTGQFYTTYLELSEEADINQAQQKREVKIKVISVNLEDQLVDGKLPQKEENYALSFQNEDYIASKKSII